MPQEDKSFIHGVWFFDVILTAFLVFLQFETNSFVNVFYWGGLVLCVFIWIINAVKGRQKVQDFKSYFFGYLLTVLFLGTNVLFMIGNPVEVSFLGPMVESFFTSAILIRDAIVLVSGIAYIIVYGLIFIGHPDLDDDT